MGAIGSFGIFLVCLLALLATRAPVGIALATVAMVGTAIFVSPGALNQLASSAFSLCRAISSSWWCRCSS
jgi:hypothetical protein